MNPLKYSLLPAFTAVLLFLPIGRVNGQTTNQLNIMEGMPSGKCPIDNFEVEFEVVQQPGEQYMVLVDQLRVAAYKNRDLIVKQARQVKVPAIMSATDDELFENFLQSNEAEKTTNEYYRYHATYRQSNEKIYLNQSIWFKRDANEMPIDHESKTPAMYNYVFSNIGVSCVYSPEDKAAVISSVLASVPWYTITSFEVYAFGIKHSKENFTDLAKSFKYDRKKLNGKETEFYFKSINGNRELTLKINNESANVTGLLVEMIENEKRNKIFEKKYFYEKDFGGFPSKTEAIEYYIGRKNDSLEVKKTTFTVKSFKYITPSDIFKGFPEFAPHTQVTDRIQEMQYEIKE